MSDIRPIGHGDLSKELSKSSKSPSVSFKDILNSKLKELSLSETAQIARNEPQNVAKLVNHELSTLLKLLNSGEIGLKDLARSLSDIQDRLLRTYIALGKPQQ